MFVEFSHRSRQITLNNLKNNSQDLFDLVIIGGGITGSGIAREAALRGLKTLLIEKNDLASGTSSRSSKLVHGGVRYLENYEFHLVFESTQERALLWKNCPQLCQPIPFLFPAFKDSRVPLWKLNLGLWLYDFLATFKIPGLHKKLNFNKSHQAEPTLKTQDLVGCIFYWDGATDDARLTLANAIDAASSGAQILNRAEVQAINFNEKVHEDSKQAHSIKIKDLINSEDIEVKARCIVSAAGPWTDQLLANTSQDSKPSKLLSTTRGSHIVVKKSKLPVNNAVVILHPKDKRVLFAIPWSDFTIIGTTDIFDAENPDLVHIRSEEVDYLLEAAKDYFPSCSIKREDVVSVWSGLRPLLKAPEGVGNEGKVSREHHIEWKQKGFLIVAGGKLTTYRKMAEDAVLKIIEGTQLWPAPLSNSLANMSTKHRPLPKLNYPRSHINKPMGESEGSHYDLEDIRGMCREQMVLSIEDLFVRRTHTYYKESDHGLSILPKIKDTLCSELSWTEEQWKLEVEKYRNYLKHSTLDALGRSL